MSNTNDELKELIISNVAEAVGCYNDEELLERIRRCTNLSVGDDGIVRVGGGVKLDSNDCAVLHLLSKIGHMTCMYFEKEGRAEYDRYTMEEKLNQIEEDSIDVKNPPENLQ